MSVQCVCATEGLCLLSAILLPWLGGMWIWVVYAKNLI
jgi:hypothetical protein